MMPQGCLILSASEAQRRWLATAWHFLHLWGRMWEIWFLITHHHSRSCLVSRTSGFHWCVTSTGLRQLLAKLFISWWARRICGLGLGSLDFLLDHRCLPVKCHQVFPHIVVKLFRIIRVIILPIRVQCSIYNLRSFPWAWLLTRWILCLSSLYWRQTVHILFLYFNRAKWGLVYGSKATRIAHHCRSISSVTQSASNRSFAISDWACIWKWTCQGLLIIMTFCVLLFGTIFFIFRVFFITIFRLLISIFGHSIRRKILLKLDLTDRSELHSIGRNACFGEKFLLPRSQAYINLSPDVPIAHPFIILVNERSPHHKLLLGHLS